MRWGSDVVGVEISEAATRVPDIYPGHSTEVCTGVNLALTFISKVLRSV